MLGVLLSRKPVKIEIINDLDAHLLNWWIQVRDNPDELAYKVSKLPHSRILFQKSLAALKEENINDVDRAVAYHAVIVQSMVNSIHIPTWAPAFDASVGSLYKTKPSQIMALADRMLNVQLECRPANEILDRTKASKMRSYTATRLMRAPTQCHTRAKASTIKRKYLNSC